MSLARKLLAPTAGGQLVLPASTVLAFSVARAFDGYTGNIIQVRRSSDDTLANIGTDADGNLDETALLAHTGSGAGDDGYIAKVYEQSGDADAVDFVQAGVPFQYQIVEDGAVLKTNGKPTARDTNTASSAQYLELDTWLTRPSDADCIMVGTASASDGRPSYMTMLGTSSTTPFAGVLQSGSSSTTTASNAGSSLVYYKDGALVGTSGVITRGDMFTAYSTDNQHIIRFGSIDLTSNNWQTLRTNYSSASLNGMYEFQELIVLETPGAGDTSDVESSQADYYGVFEATSTTRPAYDELTERLAESFTETAQGVWEQTWTVTPLTAQEITDRDNARSLTFGQFRFMLAGSGLEDAFRDYLATIKGSNTLLFARIKARLETGDITLGDWLTFVANRKAAIEAAAPGVDISETALRNYWTQAEAEDI